MLKTTLSLFALFIFANLFSQTDIPKRIYNTTFVEDNSIKVDGVLDDEAWASVPYDSIFTVWDPNAGEPPHQETKFKILYDNKYLYIGYRCMDSAPDSIVARMGRRDEFPGDWMEINIDSYHDLRTAFSFTLSVSGVRNDEFVSLNGEEWDTSFNPIWFAKTKIDEQGWTAEAKIPFSQLRFGKEKDKVWGIQIMRRIFRKEERSTWQFIPKNLNGYVSFFGELKGLEKVPFKRQLEIAPYTTSSIQLYEKEMGNPFGKGKDIGFNAGIDGKFAVTNDLILDFTANPDFGQVEADPSQVRIDGFQNFFQERRPFFVESRNIFEYNITKSDNENFGSDLLFYSRRIGGAPHGEANIKDGEYAKSPTKSAILGATKFSGKTKDGWSIGLLESYTQRTFATIDNKGQRRSELIEPGTNYFVGRLQKDLNQANTIIGGIITGVNRDNDLNGLLHKAAYSGGLDFAHYWKNRAYYVQFNNVFSQVRGSKEAIFRTQTSIEHLFQRPDATEFTLSPNATSLTGNAGTLSLGKSGGDLGKYGQVLKYELGLTYRTPEFESNDIGFMLTSNEINQFGKIGFSFPNASKYFRNAAIGFDQNFKWDFSGRHLFQIYSVGAEAQLKNNWSMGTKYTWNPYDVSNTALRGGPTLRKPAGSGVEVSIETDKRKPVAFELNHFYFFGEDNVVGGYYIGLSTIWQVIDALKVSLEGSFDNNFRKQDQYVSTVNYKNKEEFVVAGVDQNTLRFTGRLSYNITPDLTIQYYGQPFITRPLYKSFGLVVDPLNEKYDNRFMKFSEDAIKSTSSGYLVDMDKDGITDFSFEKPDFNYVEFNSNLVLRYEYKPGSEAYLVWSQNNQPNSFSDLSSSLSSSLYNNAFSKGKNIFLVKFTYRFLS